MCACARVVFVCRRGARLAGEEAGWAEVRGRACLEYRGGFAAGARLGRRRDWRRPVEETGVLTFK